MSLKEIIRMYIILYESSERDSITFDYITDIVTMADNNDKYFDTI